MTQFALTRYRQPLGQQLGNVQSLSSVARIGETVHDPAPNPKKPIDDMARPERALSSGLLAADMLTWLCCWLRNRSEGTFLEGFDIWIEDERLFVLRLQIQ